MTEAGTGRRVLGWTWLVLRRVLYSLAGAAVVLVILAVVILERRPELDPWHTADLDQEFTAKSDVTDFQGYRALEERLFAQLERTLHADPPVSVDPINRFHVGSYADPARWPIDWNRTIERRAEDPRAGVLLLHGLSDSPYSMRTLAEAFQARGATTLSLRLPGHGTAPSGLLDVRWEDWAAAVVIGMRHVRESVGDRPVYIVGYSNGGALAVHYALRQLTDDSLPAPDAVVLMSPEIGITRLAALAAWQGRLGRVLGLRKLAWNSIAVEYDPFKYRSFTINAGHQAYRLTGTIQSLITTLSERGELQRMPPVLAFQSVVDATVSAPALVLQLFARLPEGGHELVLFDLDRTAAMEILLKKDPQAEIDALMADTRRSFAVTLVANTDPASRSVVARHVGPRSSETIDTDLHLAWPPEIYSLSHVALPFPPDDPLYGGPDARESPGIQIGNVHLRGERGVLKVSAADIMRVRWNPFHSYLVDRVMRFTGMVAPERPEGTKARRHEAGDGAATGGGGTSGRRR